MDPGVHALQVLDVILMKDSTSKMTFYHNLPQVMNEIPKVSMNFHFDVSSETQSCLFDIIPFFSVPRFSSGDP